MAFLLKDVPGLEEAVAKAAAVEAQLRERAFLDVHVDICGVEVRQMTLRHYLLADAADLPIFYAEQMVAEECAIFLWIVSPRYLPGRGPRVRQARQRFMRQVNSLSRAAVRAGIAEYVEHAFLDAPRGGGGASTPATSYTAAIIDRLVSAGYAWPEERFLDAPLGRLFQYLRRAIMRNSGIEPANAISGRVRKEYVAAYHKAQMARKEGK